MKIDPNLSYVVPVISTPDIAEVDFSLSELSHSPARHHRAGSFLPLNLR